MRYCRKCLFPDTKPDIYFDEEGVCDACRSAERKHDAEKGIDWKAREAEFKELIQSNRSKGGYYDCIVAVSGGKDSTFQVYSMKAVHGMHPLAVTFDQFDATEQSRANLEMLKNIGVDHLHFTMNPQVVRKLVRKGFEIVGDPYWVNHVGIFTVPVQVAVAYKIPMIVWGENPQLEYGGPAADRERKYVDRRWRQEYGGMRGFREEDMVDGDIKMSDLNAMVYPSDEDVRRVGVTGLFYGYYFKWNPIEHTEMVRALGWKPLPKPWPGSWLATENVDMYYEDVREHLKWVKFGYGRVTDQVNIFIRAGKLGRAEAVKIVRELDGKMEHQEEFCDYIGISLKKFERIRDTFVNTDIFEKVGGEWRLKTEPF